MVTIELVGEKSVVKLDIETLPTTDLFEHDGRRYAPIDDTRAVWSLVEEEPAPLAEQTTDQPSNAESDQSPTI